MTRRLMMLLAGLLLALPMGATVAMADETGPGERETGNACPPASPDTDEDGDPACGRAGNGGDADKGNGADKGDRGDQGHGADEGDRGNQGQGTDGSAGDGETGNACPPASPAKGGDPACGDADGNDGNNGTDGNNGQDGDDGTDGDDGQGTDGNDGPGTDGDDGTDGNDGQDGNDDAACPSTSPNGGNEPPCGDDDQGPADPGDDTTDPGTDDGGEGGDDVGTTADPCSAEAGDVGILTPDTLAQTLADNGLADVDPIFEDPDADGPLSSEIYKGGEGTEIEVITDELGCLVDLLINGESELGALEL